MWPTVCFSIFVATLLGLSHADDPGFPQGTVEESLTFVFYTRQRPGGHFIYSRNITELIRIPGLFDPTHPTVVLIHGWRDDYSADSNTVLRQTILGKIDANIIKVGWSPLAFEDYITAKNAVPEVGEVTANFLQRVFIQFNYSFENLTIAGFSLGAHVAGNIGKNLPGKIPRIVGLDPAGPFIDSKDLAYSLHKSDARYVLAIHTNGGVLGMTDSVGHSDFYPNGGRRQPGCGLDLVGGCAHNRAWAYFAESITNNRFWSRQCDSYTAFQRGQCSRTQVGLMGGLNPNTALEGTYYLNTNDASPYGQGL